MTVQGELERLASMSFPRDAAIIRRAQNEITNLEARLNEAKSMLEQVGDAKDMAELTNLWEYVIEPFLERLK